MEGGYEITDDLKRDVLAATDLVSLVGATTALKKTGASWKGLCPFHGEKTPSFHVHPEKGFYFCFGCGAKGDAITFVRETERLDFPEAVAYLARRAGIPLPARRSGTRADRSRDGRAAEALAAAARFFREQLARHPVARGLLERRGIPADEAAGYGFGAAPDSWDALMRSLSGSFAEEALLEAGLLQRNPETGRVYDRFRNRLTIEIRDARGEVLGFGARALGDDNPKYLNTPETSRFSKGRLLYGLDRAREAIRKTETAVLVEGYFDRIALERAGIAGAVASMGTALTPAQADLLARHAPAVVVAYDGDPPGQAASRKAFPLLLERGVKVRHLLLPDGHDPDSFLAAHGGEALAAAVEGAPSLLDALLSGIPREASDPEGRAEKIREAAEILRAAPDRVLRYELLSGLARGAAIPLGTLIDRGETRSRPVRALREEPPQALTGAEEAAVTEILALWPASASVVGRVPEGLFTHPDARAVVEAVRGLDPGAPTLDFSELASHLGDGAGQLAARLLLGEPTSPDGSAEGPSLERLYKLLLRLNIRRLEETRKDLQPRIEAALAEGSPDEVSRLLGEKKRLSDEIRRLQRDSRFRRTRTRTSEPDGE